MLVPGGYDMIVSSTTMHVFPLLCFHWVYKQTCLQTCLILVFFHIFLIIIVYPSIMSYDVTVVFPWFHHVVDPIETSKLLKAFLTFGPCCNHAITGRFELPNLGIRRFSTSNFFAEGLGGWPSTSMEGRYHDGYIWSDMGPLRMASFYLVIVGFSHPERSGVIPPPCN